MPEFSGGSENTVKSQLGGTIMARVTIEDCLKRIPNRFLLVHVTTKRVRQLLDGGPLLIKASGNENVVTALREIASGKVFVKQDETKE